MKQGKLETKPAEFVIRKPEMSQCKMSSDNKKLNWSLNLL